ncbi:hypothetical protein G4B88_016825 [Cannabis sativa]|uniref:Ubiquitin-like protease family profile domain-containing protein n=1 Tax=Cannabis sativa TaxID=3483 RepID=A0A7J6GQ81_CANSA|nr:hypothetical protein G4B88_016825 [Cannabis sativa]
MRLKNVCVNFRNYCEAQNVEGSFAKISTVFGRTQRKKRVEVNVDSEHVAEIKRLKAEIERLKAEKNAQTEELQALDNEYINEQRHEDQEPTDIYEEQEQPLANEDQEPTDIYEEQEQPLENEDQEPSHVLGIYESKRCIWENLNQRQKELYKFYDVELLSYNNEQDKVIAINQLSIWLNTMTHVGQYYFIPWNIGKHWMLIIAMTSGRVVFLNPLKSKIPSDIAQMIKAAYANISSNAIVFGKNGPEIWTFACPKQPYNYECGYYVLTYIRDMLQHSNPIEAIKAKFGGLSQYSEDDHLLPLRQQWLNNV